MAAKNEFSFRKIVKWPVFCFCLFVCFFFKHFPKGIFLQILSQSRRIWIHLHFEIKFEKKNNSVPNQACNRFPILLIYAN